MKYTGLKGVAIRGFFRKLREKVEAHRFTDVTLRANGPVNAVWLHRWANANGFRATKIQNGAIRIDNLPH